MISLPDFFLCTCMSLGIYFCLHSHDTKYTFISHFFIYYFAMSLKALKHCNLCDRVPAWTCSSFHCLTTISTDAVNTLFVKFGVNLNLFPRQVFLGGVLETRTCLFLRPLTCITQPLSGRILPFTLPRPARGSVP